MLDQILQAGFIILYEQHFSVTAKLSVSAEGCRRHNTTGLCATAQGGFVFAKAVRRRQGHPFVAAIFCMATAELFSISGELGSDER